MEETERRRLLSEIQSLLQSELLACDVLVSLLYAAATSLRHNSLVNPFPPTIPNTTEGHKDIKQLRALLELLPSLYQLPKLLEQGMHSSSLPPSLSPPTLRLLHWTLSPRLFSLHNISIAELEAELPRAILRPRPNYAFRLQYTPDQEAWFQQLATPHGTFHAFHGSSVERFHSILHNGLLNMFNETSAFGEGIYLSTYMGVSFNWCREGLLWQQSCLPHMVKCMVVCEVIRDPSVMSRQLSGAEPSDTLVSHVTFPRAIPYQAVPDTYFVVSNDELVRVSHLLIFTQLKRQSAPSWLRSYCFIMVVVGYVLLLVLLGAWRSRWLKQLWTKL